MSARSLTIKLAHTGRRLKQLQAFLDEYLDAVGISRRGWQNPPLPLAARKTGRLTENVMDCIDAFSIIRRRTAEAGFKLGCHVFRGTGITDYLEKGGTLELLS